MAENVVDSPEAAPTATVRRFRRRAAAAVKPAPPMEATDGSAPLPLEAPTSAAWREEVQTKARELEGLARWLEDTCVGEGPAGVHLLATVHRHLRTAHDTAARSNMSRPLKRWLAAPGGSEVERAMGNIDAAEADILRLAPAEYLRGQMPSLMAHVNRYLPRNDPRRIRTEEVARRAHTRPPAQFERDIVVAAFHAANSQRRRELLRLRSFRNVLLVATALMVLVSAGVALLGAAEPGLISLCFSPSGTPVCPTGDAVSGWDLTVVEIVGSVAAAVAAAISLRSIRGTSTPYSLPVALALLKLPTGALTAVLGLLLMRGGFVPGLSALDTTAQIISWAIVFGYAQQIFTRAVDQQAHAVLEDVGGRGAAGDRPVNSS